MIYLYLKGKDTPFLCDFVHFKKLVFHFEKNPLFKNHFCGGTVSCIKFLKSIWNPHEQFKQFYNLSSIHFLSKGL